MVTDGEGRGHDATAADAFGPFFLTGFGVPAVGAAILGDSEDEALVREERLFVTLDGIFPNNFAGAVCFDGGGLFFGEASAGEDHVVMPDDGAAHGFSSGFSFPVELSGGRVVTGKFVDAGDEELFFSGDVGDNGGGPVVVALARDGPVGGAIFGFERGDGAAFFGADDDDEGVFVEDGGGAVSELVGGAVVAGRF